MAPARHSSNLARRGRSNTEFWEKHNLPERTGRGDAVTGASTSMGSSFSSSGDMVSSDCGNKHRIQPAFIDSRTIGFFLGFREPDLRLPFTVTAGAAGVAISVSCVAASPSSAGSSSDATSSCDCKRQHNNLALLSSSAYHVLLSRFPFPLSRCIELL